MQPSPNGRRVGIRIVTFEACSGFTHVTARRIAQPPKVTFVTRLQPSQLPSRTARQLPDLSTSIRVRSSLTDGSRPRGALPSLDSCTAAKSRHLPVIRRTSRPLHNSRRVLARPPRGPPIRIHSGRCPCSPGPARTSWGARFFAALKDRLRAWFADTTNGIQDFYARIFEGREVVPRRDLHYRAGIAAASICDRNQEPPAPRRLDCPRCQAVHPRWSSPTRTPQPLPRHPTTNQPSVPAQTVVAQPRQACPRRTERAAKA
jgi:hypothetical protein